MQKLASSLILFSTTLGAGLAHAGPANGPMTRPGPTPMASWEIITGAGVQYKPDYEGSDEMEASPVPLIILTHGRFHLGPDELGYEVWQADRATLGLTLGYGGERDPEDIDSGALDGLAKIDKSALLGARFDYDLGPAEVFVGLERYLGESDGTSLQLGVRREQQVSPRLSVYASAAVTFSDSNYMKTYFGVSAADAVASGYDAFEAGSGLRRADITIGTTFGLTENVLLRGEIGMGKLMGDASDSPIVLDDMQPKASLAVAYRF